MCPAMLVDRLREGLRLFGLVVGFGRLGPVRSGTAPLIPQALNSIPETKLWILNRRP